MTATEDPSRKEGRERRRWQRYPVTGDISAELVTNEGRVACRIENVSLTGARLRLAGPLPPAALTATNEALRLDYDGQRGPSGGCAWLDPERIGVQFEFCDESVALALACIRRTAESVETRV